MTESQKKFRIVTLGCRTNQYESQAYHDQLVTMGYALAEGDESADVCIVNTCTVTESADSTSRHEIRQLARQNPGAKIAVTGCFAERKPDVIRQIEGVTHVIPNKEKDALLAALFPGEDLPEFSIKRFEAHTRAFVKVQDGCNSFCSYCIIPYVRGRSKSRAVPDIVREIEGLVSNGFQEVVLTGINIGDFDGGVARGETPVRLAELVRVVDAIPGLERVRISSIDPDEVDEELLDTVLNGRKTCHSFHIVLQSGSNVVLKKMNRKYTRQIFLDTVDRLRRADPNFTFTTDVIVGFPGETEADFNETLDVMREVRFAKVHMFPYSERPGTRAVSFPNKVAPGIIKERKQMVLQVAEQESFKLREVYVSRRMQVLTESRDTSDPLEIAGHTDNFLPVRIRNAPNLQPNQLVTVDLLENSPSGLIARVI